MCEPNSGLRRGDGVLVDSFNPDEKFSSQSPTRLALGWQAWCGCYFAFLAPLANIARLDPVKIEAGHFAGVELPAFAEGGVLLGQAPFA